jgi:lipopolysaccharide/colanic/teichoic acid biosynthesis glycosyltransferase
MKRLVDIVISVVLLVLGSPIFFLLCLLIHKRMGRPVLFRQQRAGLNERPFFIYKFRTMSETRDASGNLLPDEERITPLGRILRSTSLDELPQLFNVLRGDMSMLGPRPLPVAYLDRYTPEQTRRHEVMPGMTGWAQVNGRNAISWEKKFELDVWYVDHRTLWLDLKILYMTAIRVAKREGIHAGECATMPEFRGTVCTRNIPAGHVPCPADHKAE